MIGMLDQLLGISRSRPRPRPSWGRCRSDLNPPPARGEARSAWPGRMPSRMIVGSGDAESKVRSAELPKILHLHALFSLLWAPGFALSPCFRSHSTLPAPLSRAPPPSRQSTPPGKLTTPSIGPDGLDSARSRDLHRSLPRCFSTSAGPPREPTSDESCATPPTAPGLGTPRGSPLSRPRSSARCPPRRPRSSRRSGPTRCRSRFRTSTPMRRRRGRLRWSSSAIVHLQLRLRRRLAVWGRSIAGLDATDYGIPSDATQNILWRIENGELPAHPKVVVLQAGANNLGTDLESPEDTLAGIENLVDVIHALSPTSKILVVGIFPVGEPTDPIGPRSPRSTASSRGSSTTGRASSSTSAPPCSAPTARSRPSPPTRPRPPQRPRLSGWAAAMIGPLRMLLGVDPSPTAVLPLPMNFAPSRGRTPICRSPRRPGFTSRSWPCARPDRTDRRRELPGRRRLALGPGVGHPPLGRL